MPIESKFRIRPESILINAVNAFRSTHRVGLMKVTQSEWEEIRASCGSEFAQIPIDSVRKQAIDLQRKCLIKRLDGEINGHGPTKARDFPAWYMAYLEHPEFKARFETAKSLANHLCDNCNANEELFPWHRNIEGIDRLNPGIELAADLKAYCDDCRRKNRGQRARAQDRGEDQGPGLFAEAV